MQFFRNVFGGGGGNNSDEFTNNGFFDNQTFGNNFRNPIWRNDEDDDDMEDFRMPRSGMQFHIFTNPLEMMRYFDAEMDNILKGVFSGFNNNMLPSFSDENSIKALPFAQQQRDIDLRDSMLKPDYKILPEVNLPDEPAGKCDMDLDGKVTADNFSTAWNERDGRRTLQTIIPHQRSVQKSVSKQFFHRNDGTIEQKQVFKDSEGNEETIVTRQIGDKKYTVSTKRDKFGAETKTEEFVNMNESELKDFNQKWLPSITGENTKQHSSILDSFNWMNFFEPSPKL